MNHNDEGLILDKEEREGEEENKEGREVNLGGISNKATKINKEEKLNRVCEKQKKKTIAPAQLTLATCTLPLVLYCKLYCNRV